MPATLTKNMYQSSTYSYNADMTAEKKRQEKRSKELDKVLKAKRNGANTAAQLKYIQEIDKKFKEIGIIDNNGDVTSFYRKE